jgi:pantoate--beta-alanine ligase
MKLIRSSLELRAEISQWKGARETIGLVPTMGALHQGHLSLVKTARLSATHVVVSIFVNPRQFNDPQDYDKYPKTLEQDLSLLDSVGTSLVFAPSSPEEIYAAGFQTGVEVSDLALPFEGRCRPGHFRGVCTIVSILFNLVQPDFAVFGEKDFQQLRVVEQMVKDLSFPLRIVRGVTLREEGGLAMSSRNARLSAEGREKAKALSRGLFIARDAYQGGNRDGCFLCGLVSDAIKAEPGITVEYITLVDEVTLKEIPAAKSPCRLLLAANLEGVRLIDNMPLR